jgi:hypothetical protein
MDKPVRVHDIIGIEYSDGFSFSMRDAEIQRASPSRMRIPNDNKPGIPLGDRFTDFEAAIGRTIIHQHAREIPINLRCDTFQRRRERRLSIQECANYGRGRRSLNRGPRRRLKFLAACQGWSLAVPPLVERSTARELTLCRLERRSLRRP